jgi:hypothetical protein
MRKQIMENAAHELAIQVIAVENCIESTLTELAELQMKMVRARGLTKAGFASSHPAFEQLAAATSSLVAARGGIANCHTALKATSKSIPGLREHAETVGFGPNECKFAKADLRVVA